MGFLAMIGAALLKAVLPVVATVASGYILRLLHVQLKKAHVELTAEQEQQIADLVEHAVLAVEEQARRNPRLKGTTKEQMATNIVLTERPDLPPQVVKETIDAALARLRPTLEAPPARPNIPSSAPIR